MKEALFYIHDGDNLGLAIKLVDKLYENEQKTLVLVSNEIEADIFDEKLWTFSKLSFIPHVKLQNYSDGMMVHSLISDKVVLINDSKVLLHCNIDLCEEKYTSERSAISCFEKVYNIMTKQFTSRYVKMSNMFIELGFVNKYFVFNESKWDVFHEIDDFSDV